MSLAKKIHLRPEEEIVEIVRHYHLVSSWKYFTGVAPLILVSFFMFWLFSHGWWGIALYSIVVVFSLFIIFRTWFFSRNNILVITNERVVDISRMGWLDEVVSSLSFSDIKDIFIRKKGLFANLLNYGSITIETKNNEMVLETEKIHRPQERHLTLLDARENFIKRGEVLNIEDVYDSFVDILPDLEYEELLEVKEFLEDELQKRDGGPKI